MNTKRIRIEKDSMGPMEVPADAYFGASTMRAMRNFPISDLRFPPTFIRVLGLLKLAAAKVNMELDTLDKRLGDSIVRAAQEVVDGKFNDQFVVDVFQTGSGTSTNMNANEVIANRASQLLGGELGSKIVHPNDHVNMSQSSNDIIPTAIHISALVSINEELIPAIKKMYAALENKSKEFWGIVKTGRTHLQDATPIRLGQEFLGYAGQMDLGLKRLAHAQTELSQVALGGTAVGTGVNMHPEFATRMCTKLTELLGLDLVESANHFQAQNTLDAMVQASGALRTIALSLRKVADDIRWMGSGPRAGLGELKLPEIQPGSSIMPGKVNPVIPESVLQVVAQVLGNDAAVAQAGQGGYFELNMMMPVAGYNLLQAISLLASASDNFVNQCIQGLEATTKGPDMVEKGLAICTALAPVIGYDTAADIAKEASKTGETIRQVALRKTPLSEEQLDEILDPAKMTEPGL
jgi:fumarate hydratase class II